MGKSVWKRICMQEKNNGLALARNILHAVQAWPDAVSANFAPSYTLRISSGPVRAHKLCLSIGRANSHCIINPFNAKANFVQSTRMERFLKTIQTLSCWYSLDRSRRVLSDEYPFARVSVIFYLF